MYFHVSVNSMTLGEVKQLNAELQQQIQGKDSCQYFLHVPVLLQKIPYYHYLHLNLEMILLDFPEQKAFLVFSVNCW